MSIFGENNWGARLINPVLLGISLVFTLYHRKNIRMSSNCIIIYRYKFKYGFIPIYW